MGKFSIRLILLFLLISVLGCEKNPEKTGTLMDFVPQHASVVLKISNWEALQADIKSNSLLSQFNKTYPYLFLSEDAPLLKYLFPKSESILTINKINDSLSAFTFISPHSANLFQSDSIKDKIVETLQIENKSLQRITIGKHIAYSAVLDSVFVASSSQKILMDIMNGKTERGETFKKVFDLPNSGNFTALLRGNTISITDTTRVSFTSWSAMDIHIAPESFIASGITMATDTIPQLLNVFEGQIPQQNDIASIIPIDAKGALSFTFDDAEKLQEEFRKFRGEDESEKTTGIFSSISEIGTIDLKSGSAIVLKSIDEIMTNDALARFVSLQTSFREVEIKSFSEPDLFEKTFSPLINFKKANFVFQLENFFIFTATESAAQELIASIQNNSTLKNSEYYKNIAGDLSSASSLLILKMQGEISGSLSTFFNSDSRNNINNISLEGYPLAAIQLSYDRNFAHITISCREGVAAVKNISQAVAEKFNVNLENAVLDNPQLVGANGNVVVQDVGNKLYYISENGKILWTKSLGSPILGEIQEVDLAGNGNKQLAFATKNAVYMLDRNGNDANAFPLKFKDDITQPLSVFDYDRDHNYRFGIVQGRNLLLYDKKGKTVKGFSFSKAKSDIIQSPSHIRMGKKDYILIAEESGILNILSRVGKPRVSISKTFNFSEIPLTSEDNTFVVITKENTKERIGEDGKISSQKLDVGGTYWFAMSGSTKATLDNNLLRIDGKLAELPIGLYSRPELFEINQKTYVSITETQEKKVFVFDRNANILNGFPVYGSSEASMGKSGSKNGINLAVKGDSKGVIVYSIN